MEQYYKITGLTVKMDSYGRTVEQAEPYRCESVESPDITIHSMWEKAKVTRPEYYANVSDDIGEYLFTGSSFYKQLLNFGGFMLHSSAVVVDGKAYLFSATSGTGKSTHTRLWREVFADRAVMVKDDKPFLEIRENQVIAHGSPWNGKHRLGQNISLPLRAICILERGESNEIHPITPERHCPC